LHVVSFSLVRSCEKVITPKIAMGSSVDREEFEEEIPYGCMAWRFQQQDKRQKAMSNGDW